ncbi:hypothetical protein EDD85DRAFT_939155 [Armillaria nabsnona]|nr:hypothetical protein EDD85DRAFT_939155 [Armillaria nabsnona]
MAGASGQAIVAHAPPSIDPISDYELRVSGMQPMGEAMGEEGGGVGSSGGGGARQRISSFGLTWWLYEGRICNSSRSSVAQHCPPRAGEAVIKKIEFMKSSRVPNHEFLLCYIKDRRNISGKEAVIRIERFSDSAPPQPPLEPHVNISAPSLQPLSSPSLFGPALDLFTITYMPVIAVKDHDVLSTLTFNDNSTFSAEEAAVIGDRPASYAGDEYSVLSHQCHWYAWVTYNIILETQAGTSTKTSLEDDKRMGRRGRVKIVNDAASNILIPPSDTSKQLAQTYLAKWHERQEDIKREDKDCRRRRHRCEGKKRFDAPPLKGRETGRARGAAKRRSCIAKGRERPAKGKTKSLRGSRRNSTTTRGTRLCVWIGFPLRILLVSFLPIAL